MIVKYSTIRRIRITAPMTDKDKVLAWIWKNNYHIKSIRPKFIKTGMFDHSKLIIIAEKEI